jgi:lysophospholipid acyltransferase (LPLAT)-like uncharacterized protein
MGDQAGTGVRILESLARWLAPLLIRLLGLTIRFSIRGTENIEKAVAAAGNYIFAFWHGRLFILTYVHRNEDVNVLVSTHQDGEYITQMITGLGLGTVRGSSTRGGARAVLGLLRAGEEKHVLAISPDGPRGPREQCQAGIAYVAKKTGLPVVPIGVSHKPSLVLSSWDRFMIPLPFARCVVVYGEPAIYDQAMTEESVEEARLDLENRIKAVTAEADYACGRKTD